MRIRVRFVEKLLYSGKLFHTNNTKNQYNMGFFTNTGTTLLQYLEKCVLDHLRIPEHGYFSDLDHISRVVSSLRQCGNIDDASIRIEQEAIYFTTKSQQKSQQLQVKLMLFNELVGSAVFDESIVGSYKKRITDAEETAAQEVKAGKLDMYLCAVVTEGTSTDIAPIYPNVPFSFDFGGNYEGMVNRISGLSRIPLKK